LSLGGIRKDVRRLLLRAVSSNWVQLGFSAAFNSPNAPLHRSSTWSSSRYMIRMSSSWRSRLARLSARISSRENPDVCRVVPGEQDFLLGEADGEGLA